MNNYQGVCKPCLCNWKKKIRFCGANDLFFWSSNGYGFPNFWAARALDALTFGRLQLWMPQLLGGSGSGCPNFWAALVLDALTFGRLQLWFWMPQLLEVSGFGCPNFWATKLGKILFYFTDIIVIQIILSVFLSSKPVFRYFCLRFIEIL